MNNETLQAIKEILILLASFIAAISGGTALLQTRELKKKLRSEAKKLDSESEKENAEAADIVSDAAIKLLQHHEEDTQRLRDEASRYRKLVEDYDCNVKELKGEFSDCKEQLLRLSSEMSKVLEDNIKLVKTVDEQNNRIKQLEETVKILTQQLKEAGYEPKFGKRAEDIAE